MYRILIDHSTCALSFRTFVYVVIKYLDIVEIIFTFLLTLDSLYVNVSSVYHTVIVGLVCLEQPEVYMLIIQQRQAQDYCQQVEEVVVS